MVWALRTRGRLKQVVSLDRRTVIPPSITVGGSQNGVWKQTRTFIGASNESGPHADVILPVYGVEPNEASRERGVEIVESLYVLVHIATEFLSKKPRKHIMNIISLCCNIHRCTFDLRCDSSKRCIVYVDTGITDQ